MERPRANNNEYQYMVYENDLKFRHKQNINPSRAIWDTEDVKTNFSNIKHDSLEYRIDECIKNNYMYLDLSHLNLDMVPNLEKHKNYINIKKIKFLFLNDNNLTNIGDNLSQFLNLEVLDVSNNKITHISAISSTLIELACHNNFIDNLPCHDKLERLDCSHNKIILLNSYKKLRKLHCEFNDLDAIISYPNLHWLDCSNNHKLKNISPLVALTYLDCSNTNLCGLLFGFPSLGYLLCSGTNINEIDKSIKLKVLEIVSTKIDKLPFISTLRDLTYKTSDKLSISTKYHIINHHEQEKNTYIEFEEQ